MALEDKIQAAVDRAVEAVCAGHQEELLNVRQQLQQTLDRRTQVQTFVGPDLSSCMPPLHMWTMVKIMLPGYTLDILHTGSCLHLSSWIVRFTYCNFSKRLSRILALIRQLCQARHILVL